MPFWAFSCAAAFLATGTASLAIVLRGRPTTVACASIAGAAALLLLYGVGYFRTFVVDDAFITLTYSRHLSAGLGPNWSADVRVEGYTSFLWMGLLGGAAKAGFDPVVVSQIAGFFAMIMVFIAVYSVWSLWSAKAGDSGLANPLIVCAALLGLALTDGVAYWTFSGLETALFMALVTLSAALYLRERRQAAFPWSTVALVATAMTRPEGLIVVAVTGGFKVVDFLRSDDKQAALKFFSIWVAFFVLMFGAYVAWRYTYYGYLFPNTYYAKVEYNAAVFARGMEYVFNAKYGFQLLLEFAGTACLLTVRRLRQDAIYIMAIAAALLAQTVLVGGDAFPKGRFIVPALPLLYLGCLAGLATLLRRVPLRPYYAAGLACALLVLGGLVLLHYGPDHGLAQKQKEQDSRRVLGVWLSQNTPRDYTIGAFAVGGLAYYSDRNILDMLGINDVVIAHTSVPNVGEAIAGHERYNTSYVLDDARPEIIIPSGDAAAGPVPEAEWRHAVEDFEQRRQRSHSLPAVPALSDLYGDPRLWQRYQIRSAEIDGLWFNFFVRNDVAGDLEAHATGLVNDRNYMASSGVPAAQAWRGTASPAGDRLLVSSREAGYSVYQNVPSSVLGLRPSQTYVAYARVLVTNPGQVTMILRESGGSSPPSETQVTYSTWAPGTWFFLWVEHTVERPGRTALSVHVLKLNPDIEQDDFELRQVELHGINAP